MPRSEGPADAGRLYCPAVAFGGVPVPSICSRRLLLLAAVGLLPEVAVAVVRVALLLRARGADSGRRRPRCCVGIGGVER